MADNQSAKRGKRRVRNAETVRERAVKAQANADAGELKRGIRNRAMLKPMRSAARPFRSRPFRIIATPFRWIGRIIFPAYFRNSWRELRQVAWPKWKQSRQLTVAVLLFAIVFGAIISLVDYGLDKIFKEVLLK